MDWEEIEERLNGAIYDMIAKYEYQFDMDIEYSETFVDITLESFDSYFDSIPKTTKILNSIKVIADNNNLTVSIKRIEPFILELRFSL